MKPDRSWNQLFETPMLFSLVQLDSVAVLRACDSLGQM